MAPNFEGVLFPGRKGKTGNGKGSGEQACVYETVSLYTNQKLIIILKEHRTINVFCGGEKGEKGKRK